MNIIQVCIAKGLLGSVFVPACANFDILVCLTCFHDIKTKKHSHTTCFYFLECDVISQLRHRYTKDLFCVT